MGRGRVKEVGRILKIIGGNFLVIVGRRKEKVRGRRICLKEIGRGFVLLVGVRNCIKVIVRRGRKIVVRRSF